MKSEENPIASLLHLFCTSGERYVSIVMSFGHMHGSERGLFSLNQGEFALEKIAEHHICLLIAELDTIPVPAFPFGDKPELPVLPDDQVDLYVRVKGFIEREGYHVGEYDEMSWEGRRLIDAGLVGINKREGSIWLLSVDSQNRLFNLLHEYGHQLRMDIPFYHSEYFAEAFSYVVSGCLGIRNPFSATYINFHSKHPPSSVRYLTREACMICGLAAQTAAKILAQL